MYILTISDDKVKEIAAKVFRIDFFLPIGYNALGDMYEAGNKTANFQRY
jgi:hypothetical protein